MSYPNKMTYVTRKKAKTLGLESKYGLIRDDGYFFAWYYTRNNKIYEMWHSPKTREKYKIRHDLDRHKTLIKARKFIARVKLLFRCCLCGYGKHSHALHFDHIDVKNKLYNISSMTLCSLEKVKNEMRKCRVLCANCHAEHTATQIEEGVFNNEANT